MELHLAIWRLCIPQYENLCVLCKGGYEDSSYHKDIEKCFTLADFTLLTINRQLRKGIAPLFSIQNLTFQLGTKACAR